MNFSFANLLSRCKSSLLFCLSICSAECFSLKAQPVPLVQNLSVEQLATVETLCTRVAIDPISKDLFYLTLYDGIHRIDMQDENLIDSLIFTTDDYHIVALQSLVFFGKKLFLIGDVPVDSSRTHGLIMRGTRKINGTYQWDTVAYTQPYPKSNTSFDHGFSGITISPDGDSLYINSGSRTDHGEEQNSNGLFPGAREVPLTSAIFRIPATAKNLYLPNDSAILAPYLFVDGTRNSFDLAFAPNGDLLATENSGERDDPEELNWIRQGKHYGFPWIAGDNYNLQQFPGYVPENDPLLSMERNPEKMIYFHDDPDFPPMPANLNLQEGILNLGPDANYYRDSITGLVMQADETGKELRSFTPHRSPLGLVFDLDHKLANPYCGDAFMLSYQSQGDSSGITSTNAPGTLLDPSEDLIHLELTKNPDGNNYITTATRIVSGFKHPVDAFIDGNIIYVIEISAVAPGKIYKITLPAASSKFPSCVNLEPLPVTGFEDLLPMFPYSDERNETTELTSVEVYPNSFTSHFIVHVSCEQNKTVELQLCDITGKILKPLIPKQNLPEGNYTFEFSAAELPSGVYIFSGYAGQERFFDRIVKVN